METIIEHGTPKNAVEEDPKPSSFINRYQAKSSFSITAKRTKEKKKKKRDNGLKV